MKKIKYLIIPIFLLFTTITFAQKGEYIIDEQSDWQDRIYYGGGFGLSGGSNYFMVRLSPMVGYMVSSRVSVGVGVTYEYYKQYELSDNRYGGSLFLRVNIIKQLFFYGSYQFINYAVYSRVSGFDGPRNTVGRLPLGLGISQPMGSRSSINFIIAYDVIHDPTVYASPWVFSIFFSL